MEKESIRVIQGCVNYETIVEEQTLIHIVDHNVDLEGQRSMKARNYKAKWKFKYPWLRATNVLDQTRLKCIFYEKFRVSGL